MTERELYTTGEIADVLGEPPTRVQYIIAKHRLKPVQRIGIFRLFNSQQVELIRRGLYNVQIRADK
jgi:hypothetical protein